MLRDRSKSKLSSVSLKSQIKQTIKVAMGKKQSQKNCAFPYTRRSSSVKSLRLGNEEFNDRRSSYSQLKLQKNYTKSFSQKYDHSINNSINRQKVVIQQQKIIKIHSFEWWHAKNFIIQAQTKVDQTNNTNLMYYFAYINMQRNKKQIILAIQNDTLFLGSSSFQVYLVKSRTKQIERTSQSSSKLKINSPQISFILITKSVDKGEKEDIKSSSLTSMLWDPQLERLIMNKLIKRQNKLLQGIENLSNKQSNPIFYLCLHIQLQANNKRITTNQQNISQFKFNENKQLNNQKEGKSKKKSIILQNILISKEALHRYKK